MMELVLIGVMVVGVVILAIALLGAVLITLVRAVIWLVVLPFRLLLAVFRLPFRLARA